MNPKILVAVGDMLGCGYYRCLMPYKALSEKGYDVVITNKLNPDILKDFNALILQRQHSDGVMQNVAWFKTYVPNSKIIFEFDDNFHAIPSSNSSYALYRNGSPATKNMEKMIGMSNAVTVSTEGLQREYKKFNSNISVCYNSIDDAVIDEILNIPKPKLGDNEIIIGWAGSATHIDDFKVILKPLTEIMQEFPNVKFSFMGADMRRMFPRVFHNRLLHSPGTFPVNKDGHGMQYAQDDSNPTIEYYKALRQMPWDVAVAPLERFLFNGCKSYVKLMEYGIAEIPFIASRFGPYSQYVSLADGRLVGLTADGNSEWKKALRTLIKDKQMRIDLAKNNIKYIKNKHLLSNNLIQWSEVLANLGLTPGTQPGTYEEKIEKTQKVA